MRDELAFIDKLGTWAPRAKPRDGFLRSIKPKEWAKRVIRGYRKTLYIREWPPHFDLDMLAEALDWREKELLG